MFHGGFYGFWEYWELYHKVTFDGPNRLIIINPGETVIDVQTDIYSDWKEWVSYEDNSKYPQALRTTGGDPLNPSATLKTGDYYFLLNGWKLLAPEDYELLNGIDIDGNLFSDDGSDIFTTRGTEILIRQIVSQLTQTEVVTNEVTSSVSLVPGTIVSASLLPGQTVATASYVDTVANADVTVNSVLTASYVQTVADPVTIAVGQTVATASYVETVVSSSYVSQVQNVQTVLTASYIDSPVTIAAGQYVTASLADNQIISASLTGAQETMLMELYRIFGLDPTRPLVVTPNARTAGAEISQSISKVGDKVTVTRS